MPSLGLRRSGSECAQLWKKKMRILGRIFPLLVVMMPAVQGCRDEQLTGPAGAGKTAPRQSLVTASVRDDFTDANGTQLESHVPDGGSVPFSWTRTYGGDPAVIQDNALASYNWRYITNSGDADSVELEIEVGDFHNIPREYDVGIVLRNDNPGSGGSGGYTIFWSMYGSDGIGPADAFITVGTPSTSLLEKDDVPVPTTGTHKFAAAITPSGVINVYVDGVLTATVTDPSPIPPGGPGLLLFYNGDSPGLVRITSFSAGSPLTCTPSTVERGQEVSCEVASSSAWRVTGWDFVPADNTSLPIVHDTSTSTIWSGIGGTSGTVRVNVTDGLSQHSLDAPLNVTNRPSQWRASWDYRSGPELTVADREVTSAPGEVFGRNCPQEFPTEAQCVLFGRSRVQPDPDTIPGYTATKIGSGPNQGYWIVKNIRYTMKRVANVHPGMLLTSPRKHPLPPELLTKQCKAGLGLKSNVKTASANMNQVNQYCNAPGLLGTDMTVFVPAIWGHESFGYNGGVGHETLGQQAAGEPQNDPYAAIEALVFTDSVALTDEAAINVRRIANEITTKAADDNPINGGPNGNYRQPADREMYFWEVGQNGTLVWARKPLTREY